jgi:hypothetical protein
VNEVVDMRASTLFGSKNHNDWFNLHLHQHQHLHVRDNEDGTGKVVQIDILFLAKNKQTM